MSSYINEDGGDYENDEGSPEPMPLTSQIVDYYNRFGRNRDLEQYFSISTPGGHIDPATVLSTNWKNNPGYSGAIEICNVSLNCPLPTDSQENSGEFGLAELQISIGQSASAPSQESPHSFALSTIEEVSQNAEVNLDNSFTKQLSPSSSIASQRKLEWDALGDVGYNNDKPISGLSSLERMALQHRFSIPDLNKQSEIENIVGLPTAQSTPIVADLSNIPQSKVTLQNLKKDESVKEKSVKKGKGSKGKTKIFHSEESVNRKISVDTIPKTVNINLRKEISVSLDRISGQSTPKILSPNHDKSILTANLKDVSTNTSLLRSSHFNKEIQTTFCNKENEEKPDKKYYVPIILKLGKSRRFTTKALQNKTGKKRKKVKITKKVPDNPDNMRKLKPSQSKQQEDENLSKAGSFEYLPGHIYQNNKANIPDNSAGDNTSSVKTISLESSKSLSCRSHSSYNSGESLTADLEANIELLSKLVDKHHKNSDLKKRLIKKVVAKLIATKYKNEESGIEYLSSSSNLSSKKGDSEKFSNPSSKQSSLSTSSSYGDYSGKKMYKKKSILRPNINSLIEQSPPHSAPELLETNQFSHREKRASGIDFIKGRELHFSGKSAKPHNQLDKVEMSNISDIKTSTQEDLIKGLEKMTSAELYNKYILVKKVEEEQLKMMCLKKSSKCKSTFEAAKELAKGSIKDLVKDLSKMPPNYDCGDGKEHKSDEVPEFNPILKNKKPHTVFTLSHSNNKPEPHYSGASNQNPSNITEDKQKNCLLRSGRDFFYERYKPKGEFSFQGQCHKKQDINSEDEKFYMLHYCCCPHHEKHMDFPPKESDKTISQDLSKTVYCSTSINTDNFSKYKVKKVSDSQVQTNTESILPLDENPSEEILLNTQIPKNKALCLCDDSGKIITTLPDSFIIYKCKNIESEEDARKSLISPNSGKDNTDRSCKDSSNETVDSYLVENKPSTTDSNNLQHILTNTNSESVFKSKSKETNLQTRSNFSITSTSGSNNEVRFGLDTNVYHITANNRPKNAGKLDNGNPTHPFSVHDSNKMRDSSNITINIGPKYYTGSFITDNIPSPKVIDQVTKNLIKSSTDKYTSHNMNKFRSEDSKEIQTNVSINVKKAEPTLDDIFIEDESQISNSSDEAIIFYKDGIHANDPFKEEHKLNFVEKKVDLKIPLNKTHQFDITRTVSIESLHSKHNNPPISYHIEKIGDKVDFVNKLSDQKNSSNKSEELNMDTQYERSTQTAKNINLIVRPKSPSKRMSAKPYQQQMSNEYGNKHLPKTTRNRFQAKDRENQNIEHNTHKVEENSLNKNATYKKGSIPQSSKDINKITDNHNTKQNSKSMRKATSPERQNVIENKNHSNKVDVNHKYHNNMGESLYSSNNGIKGRATNIDNNYITSKKYESGENIDIKKPIIEKTNQNSIDGEKNIYSSREQSPQDNVISDTPRYSKTLPAKLNRDTRSSFLRKERIELTKTANNERRSSTSPERTSNIRNTEGKNTIKSPVSDSRNMLTHDEDSTIVKKYVKSNSLPTNNNDNNNRRRLPSLYIPNRCPNLPDNLQIPNNEAASLLPSYEDEIKSTDLDLETTPETTNKHASDGIHVKNHLRKDSSDEDYDKQTSKRKPLNKKYTTEEEVFYLSENETKFLEKMKNSGVNQEQGEKFKINSEREELPPLPENYSTKGKIITLSREDTKFIKELKEIDRAMELNKKEISNKGHDVLTQFPSPSSSPTQSSENGKLHTIGVNTLPEMVDINQQTSCEFDSKPNSKLSTKLSNSKEFVVVEDSPSSKYISFLLENKQKRYKCAYLTSGSVESLSQGSNKDVELDSGGSGESISRTYRSRSKSYERKKESRKESTAHSLKSSPRKSSSRRRESAERKASFCTICGCPKTRPHEAKTKDHCFCNTASGLNSCVLSQLLKNLNNLVVTKQHPKSNVTTKKDTSVITCTNAGVQAGSFDQRPSASAQTAQDDSDGCVGNLKYGDSKVKTHTHRIFVSEDSSDVARSTDRTSESIDGSYLKKLVRCIQKECSKSCRHQSKIVCNNCQCESTSQSCSCKYSKRRRDVSDNLCKCCENPKSSGNDNDCCSRRPMRYVCAYMPKCKHQRTRSRELINTPKSLAYNLIIESSNSMFEEEPVKERIPLRDIIVKVPKSKHQTARMDFNKGVDKSMREESPDIRYTGNQIYNVQAIHSRFARPGRSQSLPDTTQSSSSAFGEGPKYLSVQEYLEMNRPSFVNNVAKRKGQLKQLQEIRLHQERAVRAAVGTQAAAGDVRGVSLREAQAAARDSGLTAPQLPSNVQQMEKDMKMHSRKIYKNLPEVLSKEEELKKLQKKNTNLLMAELFKKNLQKKTLQGKVDLSHFTHIVRI